MRHSLCSFLTAALLLGPLPGAWAQGLQPDPTFGAGTGRVLTAVTTAASPALTDALLDVEALPGGQLLVLAQGEAGLVKLRYLADGTLDAAFGTGGRLALAAFPAGFSSPPSEGEFQSGRRDLLADGRVLVAGTAGAGRYALLAYRADGLIDTGFGTAGVVTLDQESGSFTPQADGRILVAGTTPLQATTSTYSGGQVLITWLRPTGELQYSATLTHSLIAPAAAPNLGRPAIISNPEVVVLPDGKLLAVATATERGGTQAFLALARLLPEGRPDDSFGNGGALLHYLGGRMPVASYGAPATLVLPDGKFLINLKATPPGGPFHQAVIGRFLPGGQLDATFGQAGGLAYLTAEQAPNAGSVLSLQPDGKLLVGGSSARQIVVRLTSAGAFDPTLAPVASSPVFQTPYFSHEFDRPKSVAADQDVLRKMLVLPAGQLLLAGTSRRVSGTAAQPAGGLVALARFTEATTLATRSAAGAAPEVSFYPNPLTAPELCIRLTNLPAAPIVATLYNALGQTIWAKTLRPLAGGAAATSEALPVPALASGTYHLRLATTQWARSYPLLIP